MHVIGAGDLGSSIRYTRLDQLGNLLCIHRNS
jgi:hypothetical protein